MALGVTLLPVGVAAMALGLQLWRTVGPLKSMAEARAQAVLAWLKARGETEVGVWLVAMSFFFALALLLAVAGDDFDAGASEELSLVHWAGAMTIIAAGRELVALLLAHRREAEASRKQCPDCINEVHADAKRCHHYGYRFCGSLR